jgi:hypothetical protein
MTHSELFTFVRDQLSADASSSKKFLMAIFGLNALIIVFVLDVAAFVWKPTIASNLVTLSTILIPAVAGIVSIYLGAQGAVEVKANGVLQQQAKEITDAK